MSTFNHVRGLRPRRSVFDLSHDRKFDADMGLLYPILVEDCIPGDVWRIANEIVIRFHQPLFAPLLHEVNVFVHYFFVPYRILWQKDKIWYSRTGFFDKPGSWEDFLSGGQDGTLVYDLPRAGNFGDSAASSHKLSGSLIDFIYGVSGFGAVDDGVERPVMFPELAYGYIWNEYYRDENLQPETRRGITADRYLFRRNWEKDYFTSALPWRQKGTAPALPLALSGSTVFDGLGRSDTPPSSWSPVFNDSSLEIPSRVYNAVGMGLSNFTRWISENHLQFQNIATFDVNDLRLSFQVQKWLERNARAGTRYTEMLRSHFGDSPRDERLDRPEYIGGSKAPVIFSEVLKTSEDGTTPQGHLAGHGISADRSFCGKYRVHEFGLIMGLMSIMPRTSYQQGVNRMWLRDSKYDLYWPEFANLGEQPVYEEEIMLHQTSAGTNREVFGYQGRYDEYRYRKSSVHGNLRDTLDYWHLGRQFDTAVANRPRLNSDFITCSPRKDIYPAPSLPGMLVSFGNILKVVRPMPYMAEPGLIDHW